MKKMILKTIGLIALTALMLFNVQLIGGTSDSRISLAYLENIAFANKENDNESGDCPWWVPSSSCNKRVESIEVICEVSSQITRTFFNQSGSIVGQGIVTGGILSMSWGIATSAYTETGGSTGSYIATKVNCPTDGKNYSCTEYFPC